MTSSRGGPIGIGVLGLGYAGTEHVRAFHAHPDSYVVAVCDVDPELAQRRARETGPECRALDDWTELIQDARVEAVVVATPNHLHAEQTVAAARAGKAILLEKPPCLNAAELKLLDDEVTRSGVVCEVDMLLRWHPMCQAAREAIQAGTIGSLLSVEAEILIGELELPEPEWERRIATGGDLHLAVGCHVLDQVLHLVDDDPVEVVGLSTRASPAWEFDTTASLLVRFAGGVIGRVTASVEAKIPYELNVRVFGSEGAIVNNRACVLANGKPATMELASERVDAESLPFDRSAAVFLDTLRDASNARAPLSDVKRTFELALAAGRACSERRPVSLV